MTLKVPFTAGVVLHSDSPPGPPPAVCADALLCVPCSNAFPHKDASFCECLWSSQLFNTHENHHVRAVKRVEIVEGIRSHYFGEALTEVEKQWLVSEISSYLQNIRGTAK